MRGPRDYSDNQRALNLGPKRGRTNPFSFSSSGFKAVSHGTRFKLQLKPHSDMYLLQIAITSHERKWRAFVTASIRRFVSK